MYSLSRSLSYLFSWRVMPLFQREMILSPAFSDLYSYFGRRQQVIASVPRYLYSLPFIMTSEYKITEWVSCCFGTDLTLYMGWTPLPLLWQFYQTQTAAFNLNYFKHCLSSWWMYFRTGTSCNWLTIIVSRIETYSHWPYIFTLDNIKPNSSL